MTTQSEKCDEIVRAGKLNNYLYSSSSLLSFTLKRVAFDHSLEEERKKERPNNKKKHKREARKKGSKKRNQM